MVSQEGIAFLCGALFRASPIAAEFLTARLRRQRIDVIAVLLVRMSLHAPPPCLSLIMAFFLRLSCRRKGGNETDIIMRPAYSYIPLR